jgi:hypothetical protein
MNGLAVMAKTEASISPTAQQVTPTYQDQSSCGSNPACQEQRSTLGLVMTLFLEEIIWLLETMVD